MFKVPLVRFLRTLIPTPIELVAPFVDHLVKVSAVLCCVPTSEPIQRTVSLDTKLEDNQAERIRLPSLSVLSYVLPFW